MKTNTETILVVLNVLVWIVFIGLMVEAGALIVSYVISVAKPEAAKNLYWSLDFMALRNSSLLVYSGWVCFLVAIAVLKSYTAFLILKILTRIKLTDPFKMEIARLMDMVSNFIVAIWVISILGRMIKEMLVENHFRLEISTDSGEYLFLAGVIFIFAQIYKKGVEIQAENDLTV